MRYFAKRIAVITGAGSGIGRAIALELASHGATLCLLGRNAQALDAVAAVARTRVENVQAYEVDLTVEEDIVQLADRLQNGYGRVDMLVHSAGVIRIGPLETADSSGFDRQYFTNVRAPFLLTQKLLPLLRRCKGQVVFINSSAGISAGANVGLYAATKHALKAIADSLRQEVNADGIRVVSVYPGRTATPMQKSVCEREGKIYKPERLSQPEDIAQTVIHALSLPRTSEITDVRIRPMVKL